MNRIRRELFWMGAAMTVTVLVCAIFPRPWLGAFWVSPLPSNGGPTWVNFNSDFTWYGMVFLAAFCMTGLIRFIVHLGRKKQQNTPRQ